MAQSLLATRLCFKESEHGWALDVGSFLGGWCTAFRGLYEGPTPAARLLLIRYCRLYAYNVLGRLAAHGITIDPSVFEPKSLRQMGDAVVEVTSQVRKTKSTTHCAVVMLGKAITMIELGMKPDMESEYYIRHREGANSAIKMLLQLLYPGEPVRESHTEAVRTELLQLGGNVDAVRKALSRPTELIQPPASALL